MNFVVRAGIVTERSDWERAIGDSREAKVQAVEATYPLLGDERPTEIALEPKSWRLVVIYRDDLSEDELTSLRDGVDHLARLCEEGEEQGEGERLQSFLPGLLTEEGARFEVDLQMLRNIAEIRRLKGIHSGVREWTLVCRGQAGDDPEVLVGETLRQLTGVLAGCDCLEIVQGEGESFNSFWSRVNVARLMATESELAPAPDALSGSGFFAELGNRLAAH